MIHYIIKYFVTIPRNNLTKTISILLLLAASSSSLAQETLFQAIEHAKIYKQSERHFTPFELVTGTSKSQIDTTIVSGKLTRTSYIIPVEFEPSNIVNNYKHQLTELGAEILFECQHGSCNNVKEIQKTIKPLNHIPKSNPALISAKVQLKNKLIYVSAMSVNWQKEASLQLDIIEMIDEPLNLISVNKSYLSSAIEHKTFKDNTHKDESNSSDHPMLARLPGAYIQDYQQYDFGQTKVFSDVIKGQHKVISLEGRITDINYQLPRTYSEYEVNANYHAALTELGFIKTYGCTSTHCGKSRHIKKRIDSLAHIGSDESQFYTLYTLSRPEGNVYAMTYIIGFESGLWTEVKLIEETALINDRVSIDLDALSDKLAQTGHVALDGLLFKFDSDEMLPEAKAVIDVVAQYLTAHPQQQFYVIGHTDDQGKQSYNQVLSDKRAQAVVKQLTQNHGIAKKQLTAKGVGEYSPIGNNTNDVGKKQNRRVELVLRSDSK
ncbi:OmpA family protein [Shewanella donghaensis]|uniref:OmpA family protein n=1 Tax=Shewanella donghaensis TaxID=238836 RepID=UPI00118445EF|nr:OmpA family protein [Shewanella donghaensis]